MFRVCHASVSIHCRLVVTCWEMANLLAVVLCFVNFTCGFLDQVCIVSILIFAFLRFLIFVFLLTLENEFYV